MPMCGSGVDVCTGVGAVSATGAGAAAIDSSATVTACCAMAIVVVDGYFVIMKSANWSRSDIDVFIVFYVRSICLMAAKISSATRGTQALPSPLSRAFLSFKNDFWISAAASATSCDMDDKVS